MEVAIFGGYRLLDLDHHFRGPGIFGVWNNAGSSGSIFLIRQKTAFPRPALYQHSVAMSC